MKRIGLTAGVLAFGTDPAAAFLYQKRGVIRREPDVVPPDTVDFRYAPAERSTPIRRPGGVRGQTFLDAGGGMLRREGDRSPLALTVGLEGAGEIVSREQRIESPHQPLLLTTLAFADARMEVAGFTSTWKDEGEADTVIVTVTPGAAPVTLRIGIGGGRGMDAEVRNEGDLPRRKLTRVRRDGDSGPSFLLLDAASEIVREEDALVLRIPVEIPAGSSSTAYRLRLPLGRGDEGDIVEGMTRLDDRAAAERIRWEEWKTRRGPSGWSMPGAYGDFAVAAARLIDQAAPAPAAAPQSGAAPPAGERPDLVDEHFLSEAERYLGRDADASARLRAVWNLEDDRGMIVGAGGEANMKEMCAAVYSLCRHAELTGDWNLFNELYPDAFNALDHLRQKRDKAGALSEPSANAARKLLPEGSPGTGWEGLHEEMTNTLWALIALKQLLDISDRHFLMKKSEIREFYGQLRLAFVSTARDRMTRDAAGFSWFPMVAGPAGAASGGLLPQQAGLGDLALGLHPGLLFKKDEVHVRDFPARVKAALAEEIPAGTGAGGADSFDVADAAVVAQALIWFGLPEEARAIFIGFLNHAAPTYAWGTPATAGGGILPAATRRSPDPRAAAEAIRTMRHAMVMEDDTILRLFDGIGAADLAPEQPLRIEGTPTRWGRVSAALEPVDRRTWKATFRREPVNPEKAPPLASVELPRVLGPNFRFDTITPVTAIKNGPRVVIEGTALAWEAILRDLRR